MATNNVFLRITGPDGAARDQEVAQESIIIGSGAAANVRIDDDKISSIHAMLKVNGGNVSVIDLNSDQGVKLSGKAVHQADLASGDVLELGKWKIRVVFGDHGQATEVVTAKTLAALTDEGGVATAPERPAFTEEPKAPLRAPPPAARVEAKPAPRPAAARPPPPPPASVKASQMFDVDVPADERPTATDKILEVVMLWGDTVIEARQFEQGRAVKVGGAPANEFQLVSDLLPTDPFLLVATGSQTSNLYVPPACEAVVKTGWDAKVAEKKATGTVAIGTDDRAILTVGGVRFLVRYAKPAKHIPTGLGETIDYYFVKVLSGSFMLFLIFLAMMFVTPLNVETLSDDLLKNPSKYAHLVIKPPEKETKKKVDLSGIKEGAKAKGDEGKFGKKEAKKQDADPSKKGSPIVNANKREEDRKKVLATGLLGALGGLDGAASNVLGPGGLGTGINNAFGGIKGGAGMGDAHGVGGLGSRGSGAGGGGTALGIGGLGTKGSGRGSGGYGSIDLGGHGKGMTRIVPGKTTVVGSLSREEIERVIKRHQNEIKFCYEVELQKDPNLYGKVQLTWTIDGGGNVSDADVSQTTMNNQSVEGCIAMRVKRWRFPEPKGGGQVIVTYPWVFKAAGSGDE